MCTQTLRKGVYPKKGVLAVASTLPQRIMQVDGRATMTIFYKQVGGTPLPCSLCGSGQNVHEFPHMVNELRYKGTMSDSTLGRNNFTGLSQVNRSKLA